MKLRKLFVKLLFNKRQREVMYKALVYSAYSYQKYGNIDKAVMVRTVINEVSSKLGVVPEKFTREEVDNIVNNIFSENDKANKDAYLKGVKDGKEEAKKEMENNALEVGTVIDVKKCEDCDVKDKCVILKAISELELEDEDEEDYDDEDEDEDDEETLDEEHPDNNQDEEPADDANQDTENTEQS